MILRGREKKKRERNFKEEVDEDEKKIIIMTAIFLKSITRRLKMNIKIYTKRT